MGYLHNQAQNEKYDEVNGVTVHIDHSTLLNKQMCIRDRYKDDEFVIIPEVFGTTIQNDQLINAVEKAFQTRQDSINLKEQHIYNCLLYTST